MVTKCLHFLLSCPPNNWKAHPDMTRRGPEVPCLLQEENRKYNITLCGPWEREEGCREKLHWNGSSCGLYIWNVFTNLWLRSQLVLLWDGNSQDQNHLETADELSLNSPSLSGLCSFSVVVCVGTGGNGALPGTIHHWTIVSQNGPIVWWKLAELASCFDVM